VSTISSSFVSVVAYLHNDEAIAATYARESIGILQAHYENFELVLVDDGSRDGTIAGLSKLLDVFPGIRIVRLSRRFGEEIAFSAGLETAIGDIVVTMLPDVDRPALIPTLVEKVRAGAGVVFGVDANRGRRSWMRRIGSNVFHWICRVVLDIEIPRHATQLRAFSRPALNALVRIKDRFRFMRLFMPYIGFKTEAHEYQPESLTGRAHKEKLFTEIDTALSVITSSSTRPLRYVSWLGVFAGGLNLLYIVYVLLIALFKKHVAEGWTTLSAQHGVMFFFLFMILAVTAEYIGRILNETHDRPLYFVAQELNSSVLVPRHERRNVVADSE
jgi:glycosyltransferase involved in cell wall biosynthesis